MIGIMEDVLVLLQMWVSFIVYLFRFHFLLVMFGTLILRHGFLTDVNWETVLWHCPPCISSLFKQTKDIQSQNLKLQRQNWDLLSLVHKCEGEKAQMFHEVQKFLNKSVCELQVQIDKMRNTVRTFHPVKVTIAYEIMTLCNLLYLSFQTLSATNQNPHSQSLPMMVRDVFQL